LRRRSWAYEWNLPDEYAAAPSERDYFRRVDDSDYRGNLEAAGESETMKGPCCAEGCGKPSVFNGLCAEHLEAQAKGEDVWFKAFPFRFLGWTTK
jgi:hypothetical protein